MVLTAFQKSFRSKTYLLSSLAIPTIISAALLVLSLSNTDVGSDLKTWVTINRAPIQIVVQVLSMLMGACQIYALSTSIVFWTNTHLSTTPISLDTLKLLDAITTARLDLNVPIQAVTILLVYLTAIRIPSALWAGALTPVFTNTNATAQYTIPLKVFGDRFVHQEPVVTLLSGIYFTLSRVLSPIWHGNIVLPTSIETLV